MKEPRAIDFLVERGNLRHCKFVHAAEPDEIRLHPGEVLLEIAKFAFTANNVTYAVAGDMMSYWSFFPAEVGWGRVPVWGFGDVARSRLDEVGEGERVFGYFPMSTHLVVQPIRSTPGGFVDGSSHRQALPAVYNQYSRVATDPGYTAEHEDQQLLFRPLFMTAFLLEDLIADSEAFGARAIVLSSASSKTAFGLAFLLHQKRDAHREVIGLTSPGNVAFVSGLGCYDRVVTYDRIDSLPREQAVVFVDMAGNGDVVSALHHHYRDSMKYSCIVGLTHWERRTAAADLPGAQPTFFFAPTQLQKRTREWGAEGFQERYAVAWRGFVDFATRHLRVVSGRGPAAVERVYLETLEGRTKPDVGHILSLAE
ncbi:MAG TPA: DUF2855 family protein [Candidatus Nitrosopolaris sp.]|nr:DUF2855 family protein [Candidatus Nitrosopolaris sp.]